MWQKVEDIKFLKINDLVKGSNFTYSQKYIERIGFEEYNEVRIGKIINSDFKTFFEVKIHTNEYETFLVYDCGTSGWYEVEKWYD